MFAGHFAVGLALKSRYRNVPTWALLFATQLCDGLWIILSWLDKEHFRLFFTPSGVLRLDLYDAAYSHSLFWSAFYALVVFLLFVRAEGQRHWAVPLSLAVFSHWFLDWLIVAPSLPFANFGPAVKFGAGLGEIFPLADLLLEAVIVLAGWRVYDRSISSARSRTRWGILAVLIVALLSPRLLQRLL